MTLLEVRDLSTHFTSRRGTIKAVDGVSFSLDRGEALAIVGESASGKSVMARSLIRLIPEPPGKIVDGAILLDGEDILKMSARRLRDARVADALRQNCSNFELLITDHLMPGRR